MGTPFYFKHFLFLLFLIYLVSPYRLTTPSHFLACVWFSSFIIFSILFTYFYLFAELETYGAVVSTLRAQGELNKDRRKLLEDLSVIMKISPERHKAEIRRAVNDEKLSEIADK